MNPRVSRSSALASKATGFPIAKIAAKLAVGYTLDELHNEMIHLEADSFRRGIPASFEPAFDYVVTKMPRFAFEKFRDADLHLTTQMKSVGEVMAIGRTFQDSFQNRLTPMKSARKSVRLARTVSGLWPMRSESDSRARTFMLRQASTRGSWRRSSRSCSKNRHCRNAPLRNCLRMDCGA